MGVRLYPSGEYNEELLASVPAGTADRLNAYDKTMPKTDGPEMDQWYKGLMADDAMDTLSHFRLFGWGRINPAVCEWIDSHGLNRDGGSVKGSDAATLLRLQCVEWKAEGVTAVSWG